MFTIGQCVMITLVILLGVAYLWEDFKREYDVLTGIDDVDVEDDYY